jgi:lipopolysaccharide export system permease protein
MSLIGRYIFKSTAGAFLAALIVLTAVVWITQALRELDLLTAQGQTIRLFFYLTALALPALIIVIAPVALLIACLHVLNKLNTDSELVVIHAAGTPPWQIAKPFLFLGMIVTLLTALLTMVLMPESARALRNLVTQVRADVLTYMVTEGRFTSLERNLTFHVRERRTDGVLLGLLVHDERDPQRVMTYLAEEGRIVREGDQAFLVMDEGSVHQSGARPEELSIVIFDRYVFDLSSLAQRSAAASYQPRELRLGELLSPDPDNFHYQTAPGRFRSELHERLSSPLYPLAFTFIALAALGRPRTNRQGRGSGLMAAILAAAGLRTLGFSLTNLSATQPWAVVLMYATPVAAMTASAWITFGQRRDAPDYFGAWPARLALPAEMLVSRMSGPMHRLIRSRRRQ